MGPNLLTDHGEAIMRKYSQILAPPVILQIFSSSTPHFLHVNAEGGVSLLQRERPKQNEAETVRRGASNVSDLQLPRPTGLWGGHRVRSECGSGGPGRDHPGCLPQVTKLQRRHPAGSPTCGHETASPWVSTTQSAQVA